MGNALGLSIIAFASYLDVYSHSHFFIGSDPWWNPAHLLLYSGFAVVVYGTAFRRPNTAGGRLLLAGISVSIMAAAFNEVWHHVLLFGNPLPEPFPVEPPHALLAIGIIMIGVAALLDPLADPSIANDSAGKLGVAFTAGSLWLIIAGSAFYVGGAYGSGAAFFFAIAVGSFSSSLFINYSSRVGGKFGLSTASYLWFLAVYFVFFVPTSGWFPIGTFVVALLDFMVVRGRVGRFSLRPLTLFTEAVLYGLIYYPVLPPESTLAVNLGLVASAAGVSIEYVLELIFVKRFIGSPTNLNGRRSQLSHLPMPASLPPLVGEKNA